MPPWDILPHRGHPLGRRVAALRGSAMSRNVIFSQPCYLFFSRYKKNPTSLKPDCVVRIHGKSTPGGIGCACTSYPWSYCGASRRMCRGMSSWQSFSAFGCFPVCKYRNFSAHACGWPDFFAKNCLAAGVLHAIVATSTFFVEQKGGKVLV